MPAPFRPISATRSPAPTSRSRPRSASVRWRPSPSSTQSARAESAAGVAGPPPGAGGPAGARRRRRCGPAPAAASRARASRTEPGDGSPAPAKQPRRRGREGGVARAAPSSRNSRGGPSKRDRAAVHRHHPVGRREAALEPVLAEQDGDAPVLVQPAQQRDQLVARDRVELGGRLVEQHQRGPGGERGGEGDALQLAARERVGGALEQPVEAERQRDLLDGARPRRRRAAPRSSSGSAISERDRRAHHLGLGLLGDQADRGGQLRGAM